MVVLFFSDIKLAFLTVNAVEDHITVSTFLHCKINISRIVFLMQNQACANVWNLPKSSHVVLIQYMENPVFDFPSWLYSCRFF